MRAALYARFSTDMQRSESIEDQLAACRIFCQRNGLTVVAEYSDAAISGASVANRPGLGSVLRGAREGAFDVLVTEALDRLSRSQGDTATLFEDLRFHGVAIKTLSEGDVEELAVGLKGTMNALFLRDIARKTRRGMVGVAKEGRHAAGPVYGYRIVRRLDEVGQYLPGLREIDEVQAEVVVGIFRDYAAGLSPRVIAAKLNQQGVAAPRGGLWNASTINGNAARGNGILHNQLYRGLLVWGRQTWSKSRETGARRARAASPSELIRTEVPDLRIVPEELWNAVRDRYQSVALGPMGERPEAARRPVRLLSGLVHCGVCGAPLVRSGPDARLVCSAHRERGDAACTNGRGVKSAEVETRVTDAIKGLLLDPAVIEDAMRELQTLIQKRRAEGLRTGAKLQADLAEVKRRAGRLIDQVADGVLSGLAIKEKLEALDKARSDLEAQIAETAHEPVLAIHPATAMRFRELVERLNLTLAKADTAEQLEARNAFRAIIHRVTVTPEPERGRYKVTVQTQMAALSEQSGHKTTLGAGTGFEPVTFRL